MKKNSFKKLICVVFAFMFVYVSFITQIPNTYASEKYINILHKISTTPGNVPINYNFTLSKKSDIFFVIRTNEKTTVTVNVKEPGHDVPNTTITLADTNPDWKYKKESGIYQNTAKTNLAAGDYILEVQFGMGVNYDLSMNQMSQNPTLSKKSLTITKGFSDIIKVNGGKIKSCSSSNKSVASVNNKGKVTAKSNGKANIKVKLSNGKTLSCKITVVSNKYSAKKIDLTGTVYNTCAMKAYDAHFNSKGNIVVKFKIVNNNYGKIDNIPNFKINVKNASKKTIVSYSKANYKITVKGYGEKACTMTIPKSAFKVNKKQIDLRTAKFTISGDVENGSF